MNVVGIICARGGSKGVPRKNVKLLAGKPLIAHTIECALDCSSLDRVIVSTDDEEIATVAKQYGAEVPFMRPDVLAKDNASHWDVWRHALTALEAQGCRPDVLVDLHTTCPLRAVEDVEGAIALLWQSTDADGVLSVCESHHNPYFNMVEIGEDGDVHPVCRSDHPLTRRQDAPVVYEINGAIYALRAEYVLRAVSMLEGRIRGYVMPSMRSIDIDSDLDFAYAGFVLSRHDDA